MRLQDVIQRGLAADRPLATAVAPGTLYYSTDTETTDRSDGTTWETYADASSGGGGPHHLTHEDGGTDEVTLAQSQITNLATDLAAKASTTHASTHASGGSDPVTLAQSQVTNLVTDLAGKASTTDPRFTDSRTPTLHATTHQAGGTDKIKLDDLEPPDDNTDLNASTTKHGLLQKLPGGTTTFLRADGTFAAPPAGGGPAGNNTEVQFNDGGAFGTESAFTYTKATNLVTILSGGLALGPSPALTGQVRLANTGVVNARNAAGNADITLLTLDASNNIKLGSTGLTVSPAGVLSGDGSGLLIRRQITVVIDNGTSVITTGFKTIISLPVAGTLKKWRILADVSGSIVIDIWKDTYANYPPTVADTITASAKPTLSSALKNESSTLTGWTTAFAAGDVLGFNVDSVTSVKKISLVLEFE